MGGRQRAQSAWRISNVWDAPGTLGGAGSQACFWLLEYKEAWISWSNVCLQTRAKGSVGLLARVPIRAKTYVLMGHLGGHLRYETLRRFLLYTWPGCMSDGNGIPSSRNTRPRKAALWRTAPARSPVTGKAPVDIFAEPYRGRCVARPSLWATACFPAQHNAKV